MGRIRSLWLFLGLVLLLAVSNYDVSADVIPSENECRPYIEKAIHELKNTEATPNDNESNEDNENNTTEHDDASIETTNITTDDADNIESNENVPDDDNKSQENESLEQQQQQQQDQEEEKSQEGDEQSQEEEKPESGDENEQAEDDSKEADNNDSKEEAATDGDSKEDEEANTAENTDDTDSKEVTQEADADSKEEANTAEDTDSTEGEATDNSAEEQVNTAEETDNDSQEPAAEEQAEDGDSKEETQNDTEEQQNDSTPAGEEENDNSAENEAPQTDSVEDNENTAAEQDGDSKEQEDSTANESEQNEASTENEAQPASQENENDTQEQEENTAEASVEEVEEEKVRSKRSISDEAAPEEQNDSTPDETANESTENADDGNQSQEEAANEESEEEKPEDAESGEEEGDDEEESNPNEEDLTMEFEIPKNLRSRDHISELLGLDAESSIKENALKRTGDVVLKELKKVYDNAVKPLEQMYKYRELSNRHYGDPEIFSKPLVLFMGPWSGGKSTILNYLTSNEYTPHSIRSGAEPSPAYFNIMMHGDEPEVLDGTEIAADWTFSGLQKFGQGLMDRLRGQKLPNKLLERVNIVEIPGILEVRKQVSRYFPFNDACQWFIDRADIIFLVYDPSKLDVGPETEAILDQLKGREYQTRILLNKADQVKPEELLRVQGALIWNISPLMSSAQPPVMYTVSLWSHPFEQGSPARLLQAQERAFLADLREAIDKRIENKIASARRFAVRIRNHAKMVDCYLTTYYNQKSLFSNKKQVSDKIIEHPQDYNIYEGLSTLTNISRYDLPDPEVYLDFFRLNPLYEFKKLSETCTYFKGCPINKLDIAIAYDLPELVGKYKKLLDENFTQLRKEFDENCNTSEVEPPIKINHGR